MPSLGFAGLLKVLISTIGSKRSKKPTGKLPEVTPADIKEAIDKGAASSALDWTEDEDLLDVNGW